MRPYTRIVVVTIGMSLSLAGCVAVSPLGGNAVFEGSKTVHSGERVDGDLLVISGSTTVEEGGLVDGDLVTFSGSTTVDGRVDGDVVAFSAPVEVGGRVDGDLVAFSGPLTVNGTVDGDILAFSGPVTLGAGAHVTGDLATVSGPVTRAPGSRVDGSTGRVAIPAARLLLPGPGALLVLFLAFLLRIIVLALIAVLVAALWPAHVVRMQRAASREPVIAGIVGVSGQIGAIAVCMVLAITGCLLPFSLLGLLLLAAVTWFGWAALGTSVGQWLRSAFGATWGPVACAGIGTTLLTFAVTVIEAVPCLGWLLSLLLHGLALGVALLTLLGRRDYPLQSGDAPPPALESTAG